MTKSTDRVAKHRAKCKAKGWVRRDYHATPEEHEKLRFVLDTMQRRRPK